tara:strand:+ start:284 stop:505 length:222 start_codon:yes stop_codon:yes gene_type:complete
MLSHVAKFGIYLNTSTSKVVRITSPYWFPPEPEWIKITDETNETLVNIRELIRKKSLVPKPDEVSWGRIPLID